MGSKKALRKRGNFSHSKPPASWRHEEACMGRGTSTLDPMQMAPPGAEPRGAGRRLE